MERILDYKGYLNLFNSLDDRLKEQALRIAHKYDHIQEVREFLSGINASKIKDPKVKSMLVAYAVYSSVPPISIADDDNFDIISLYSNNRQDGNIRLTSILKESNSENKLRLYSGRDMNGKEVIIKAYQTYKRDTSYECSIYKKLGMPCPILSVDYKMWGLPVLVMERLYQLSETDDPYNVGIGVLRQLKNVFKYGVHSDIKPANIMKKMVDGRMEYHLIDYGGMTMERMDTGYRRFTHTKYFVSQSKRGQKMKKAKGPNVVHPWNDLKELGYTMKGLQLDIKKISYVEKDSKGNKIDNVRNDFKGRLGKYMKYIDRMDEVKEVSDEEIDILISILSGGD